MSPPASSSSFLHTNTEWHRILHDFITQVVKVSLPTMLHITKGSCATLPLLKSRFRGFRTGIEVAANDFVCSERTLSEPPPATQESCSPRSRWAQLWSPITGSPGDWTFRLTILLLDPLSFHSNHLLTGRTEKLDTCHEAHSDFQLILFNEAFPKVPLKQGVS